MDVVLLSGRAGDRRAAVESLAAELAAAGHRVRWVCPRPPTERPPAPDGVEVLPVDSVEPAFRRVTRRVADFGVEELVFRLLRNDPPDVFHQCAYGAGSAAMSPWHAARLGVPSVVSVDVAPALCHRETLVDDRGEPCDRWDDPDRCAQCCRVSFEAGLTPWQAWLARALQVMGGFSPFPHRGAFESRLETVVGGLVAASLVVVDDDDARRRIERAGVPRRSVLVAARAQRTAEWWNGRYSELAGAALARA